VLLALAGLAACGLPRDIAHTSDEALSRGFVRAGVITGTHEMTHGRPTGPEVEVVEGFADDLGLTVEWTVAPEQELMERLERFELDVVVGAIAPGTPYGGRVAITSRLGALPDRETVAAVPPGENDWLLAFNRFVTERVHG
jgi:hypothetical protein